MSQHFSEQFINRVLSHDLSPAEILAADDHLAECDSCRAAVLKGRKPNDLYVKVVDNLMSERQSVSDHLDYQQMSDFVDGTLGESDRAILDEHVELCSNCRSEVKDLRLMQAKLASLPDKTYSPAPTVLKPIPFKSSHRLAGLRIPLLAAAALVLAVIVWFLVLYSRKQPEIVRDQPDNGNRQVATANVSPSPIEQGADNNPPEQKGPDNSATLVELNDGNGRVALKGDNTLEGLDSAPANVRREVEAALKSGRLKTPTVISELRGTSGQLMGAGDAKYGLEYPVASVIETRTPEFRWKLVDDATNYVVTVYDSDSNKVASSGPISQTTWRPKAQLERGRIYSWQVRANTGGAEVLMPPPAAADAKFKILDATRAGEIAELKKSSSGSHLAMGVAYADAGLLQESARELRRLVEANPKSPVAQSLLRSVDSQLRSKQQK